MPGKEVGGFGDLLLGVLPGQPGVLWRLRLLVVVTEFAALNGIKLCLRCGLFENASGNLFTDCMIVTAVLQDGADRQEACTGLCLF